VEKKKGNRKPLSRTNKERKREEELVKKGWHLCSLECGPGRKKGKGRRGDPELVVAEKKDRGKGMQEERKMVFCYIQKKKKGGGGVCRDDGISRRTKIEKETRRPLLFHRKSGAGPCLGKRVSCWEKFITCRERRRVKGGLACFSAQKEGRKKRGRRLLRNGIEGERESRAAKGRRGKACSYHNRGRRKGGPCIRLPDPGEG